MHNKLKLFFLLLFAIVSTTVHKCYAQDLNYFVLGKEELKNAEIYSILQTKDLRLFVATNEGLYQYKHGEMKLVSSNEKQLGISLFNLIENKKGDVFCYNLNGQIFTIKRNKLELYQTIPANSLSASMSMEFDEDDNLIVGSKGCFIIKFDSIKPIYHRPNEITKFSKLPDGRIFISTKQEDTLFQISRGRIIPNLYKFEHTSEFNRLIYILGKKLINVDRLNEIRQTKEEKKLTSLTSYFQFNNKTIWRKNHTSGIEKLVIENDMPKVKEIYFKNTFISHIAEGVNGELFLGTFGKGLFVIPNKNIFQYKFKNLGNNIQSIASNKKGTVFISDRINGILSYHHNQLEKLNVDLEFIPEKIFSVEDFHIDVNRKFPTLFYNNSGIYGALKNIDKIDKHTMLLSTSEGLYKFGNKELLSDTIWKPIKDNIYLLKDTKTRCLDAIYTPAEKAIYISTISSLIKVTEGGTKEILKLKNKELIGNDLLTFNDEVWVATQSQGIVVFKGGEFLYTIDVSNGLANNYVNKIHEKNGIVYISTKSSFQMYNTKNKTWQAIGFAEGIEDGSVNNFTVTDDAIWLASNNTLVSIPINFKTELIDLELQIDSIKIGNKYLEKITDYSFNSKENKLSVFPDFSLIPYQNEASYSYQLIGFDDKRRFKSVLESKIQYDYLPPGDYNFLINVKFRDRESSELTYNFSIRKPYWQTWWFYAIVVSAVVIIGFYYTAHRAKRLKKTNAEKLLRQSLKMDSIESELRALRSQMNPHFIFNSLNSIQDLILKQDTNASYDYIVLFSDLVRNSLNYSNRQYISVEEEISFLNTYLKLEKLRFGSDFQYSIINKCLVDKKIPSLVIQPFVENAIVHGLFHKKGKKNLNIEFTPYSDGLQCTITDNGIGRKKALEIQKRQGEHHSSYAMEAIKKRLKILEKKYNKTIGFVVKDLISDEASSGTQIVITFPNITFFK